MYKIYRTVMSEINKMDFESLIESAKEAIKQGDVLELEKSKEEQLKNGKLPSHVTKVKIGNDFILYASKYVNATSNPLATGYYVDVFIKESE